MKKFLFLLFGLFGSFVATTQNQVGDQFFEKYKEMEEVSISEHRHWAKKLLPGFYSSIWVEKMIADGSLKIAVLDAIEVKTSDIDQLKKELTKATFDLLVHAKAKEEFLEFYTLNDENWITNLLFLAEEDGEFAFLHLEGKWTINDIINRSRSVD